MIVCAESDKFCMIYFSLGQYYHHDFLLLRHICYLKIQGTWIGFWIGYWK